MSNASVRSIGEIAAETAVDVAWTQWSSLTAAATPVDQPRVWSIIDPEALILLSLAVRDRERRLDDLLVGWARIGASLLSVQRLKTLARDYPAPVREQVPDFARYAAEAGDRRWRSHAGERKEVHAYTPRRKDLGPLRLVEGPALMLRLRAGIGVGAKADLLSFLLGRGGVAADLKTIALATGYTGRAMRTAAEEMALARFIQEVAGPPNSYLANPHAWGSVLKTYRSAPGAEERPGIPPWRFWSVAFAFLTAVIHWESEATQAGWSAYVASSRARDLVEAQHRRLRYLDVPVAGAADARGADYLEEFRVAVEAVSTWVGGALTG